MKSMIAEHDINELIDAKNHLLESWHKIQDDKLFRATPINYKCKNCDFLKFCKEGQNLVCGSKMFGKIEW
jgi:radical SAM protein with 4Fe4S-binding SPASM domain